MKKPTIHQIKRLLKYDSQTGLFYRRLNVYAGKGGIRRKAGTVAGYKSHGYIVIGIEKNKYPAHVLAWFYMTGNWPKNEIDHIDLNKSNNAWKNLRSATHQENGCNTKKRIDNKSGFKGVSTRKKDTKWYAHIRKAGKTIYIGTFHSKVDAAIAYDNAAKRLHGEFARLNF